MNPIVIALIVLVFTLLAEWLHWLRVRRLAPLAFPARGKGARWAGAAFAVRALACTAAAWGLAVLFTLDGAFSDAKDKARAVQRHIILVLDVSPSMRLTDAGPNGQQMRNERVKDAVLSVFERISLDQARVSIIAVYNGAKPVVSETADLNVVKHLMEDTPLRWAFTSGKTTLFAGLQAAADMAKAWPPGTATVILASDGDTTPDVGMPRMPPSVSHVLALGVGSASGKFVDGHLSRQDVSTLRQIATRLGGTYVDVNTKLPPSSDLRSLSETLPLKGAHGPGLREAALGAAVLGAALLAGLPLVLAGASTRLESKAAESAPKRSERALLSQN